MTIIDISVTLTPDLVVWPGEKHFERVPTKDIDKDGVVVSNIGFGSHTGTHIDAPKHFVKGGISIDQIDLNRLIGPCQVIEYIGEGDLTLKECVDQQITQERVLFKLGNSPLLKQKEFIEEYRALTSEVAEFLVEGDIKLVGVDYLSVERKGSPGHPTHIKFLKNEVVIIEGLDLENVEPGEYQLIALPLKIESGDGCPARVVLIKE